jgi:glycosyltransferase involved in cell wall biosynthesis
MGYPARIVFAGRASTAKGLDTALIVVSQLFERYGDNIRFDIVGGGREQAYFEQWTADAGLEKIVNFHGWLPHHQVLELLIPAHFLFLPSKSSEGWPKVLSEAMTCGAVPIASGLSAIPQVLEGTQAGIALPGHDVPGFVQAIARLIDEPERWYAMSQAGLAAAPLFTYERYLMAVDELFATAYGASPLNAAYVNKMRHKFDSAGHDLPRQFWLESV